MVTGVSSYSRPSGKAKPFFSQKVRRKTLLQAMRSATSLAYRDMWVRTRASPASIRISGTCQDFSPLRWKTLPVAKSEPLSSRLPTMSR